jgi:MFS family permease
LLSHPHVEAPLLNTATTGKPLRHRRFHRGYAVMLATFVVIGLGNGATQYSFGFFISPLEQEFGWTRTQINGALAFSFTMGLMAPISGRAVDRIGARWVMTISLLVVGVSIALRPLMTELWHWYALHALLFGGFVGAIVLPAGKLLGLWFRTSYGKMVGITYMGANFGGLVIAPIANLLIQNTSWQTTSYILGGACIVWTPVAYLLSRDPAPHELPESEQPQHSESGPSAHRVLPGMEASAAFKTWAFYAALIGMTAAGLTYLGVLSQVFPHLINEGVSVNQAAVVISAIGLFGMAGKLLFGYLGDRVPVRYLAMVGLFLEGIAVVALIYAANAILLWAFVVLYGLSFGGFGMLFAVIIRNTFGIRAFGTIFGVVNLISMVAAVGAPLLAGYSFDATGSYQTAFVVIAVTFAVGGMIIFTARPPKQMREQAA